MSTAPSLQRAPAAAVPPLVNGDRLAQPEFHRRYEAMGPGVRAELIGGIVFMSSPLRLPHGTHHLNLSGVLWLYQGGTPGVEAADNATVILGPEKEPQPDSLLRILPEFGGQSDTNEDQYVVGPPEFLGETAHSTRGIDMHLKKRDYKEAGVLEYVVVCVGERELHWFQLPSGKELKPDAKGIYRSRVFPGLWIDGPALLAKDQARLVRVLKRGLASPEHAAFVKRLQARRKKTR